MAIMAGDGPTQSQELRFPFWSPTLVQGSKTWAVFCNKRELDGKWSNQDLKPHSYELVVSQAG